MIRSWANISKFFPYSKYKTFDSVRKWMDERGQDGWEVTGMFERSMAQKDGNGNEVFEAGLVVFFKRPGPPLAYRFGEHHEAKQDSQGST